MGSASTVTYEDAQAIADPRNITNVVGVAPERTAFAQVVAMGQNVNTRIVGTTPDYQSVRNFYPAVGEFMNRQHLDGHSSVAVLGAKVAQFSANWTRWGRPSG